jgi:general secretion pathway protein D
MSMKAKLLALACAMALAAPQSPAQRSAALASNTPVTLNFVNADIDAVTRAMSNMLGQPIVVDPRVKGVVTLYSEQPLRMADAYAQYLAALRGLGFSVVNVAGLLKVVPEADAKLQATGVIVGDDSKARGDQVLTQVFQLRHENANNLVAVLRPLVNVNNTINANPGNNSLVITDYADNLQRIAKIIAALDTPSATDVEVVQLQHQVASELAALVQRLGDGAGGAGQIPGQPALGGSSTVLADPRGNALILRAPNPARLAALKRLVQQLDVATPGVGGQIRVVHLKNADAVKLATVLRAAFAAQGANASGGGSPGGASTTTTGIAGTFPGAASMTAAPTANNSTSGVGQSQAATAPLGQSAGPSTGGNVQADPSTNSLIITAAEPLYRQMRAVIDQLDTRRAQIYVEAIIVKVDANKAAQFGVQWQSLFGRNSNVGGIVGVNNRNGTAGGSIVDIISGATSGSDTGAANAIAGIAGGFNVGLLGKINGVYSLGAIANFLENQTGANILSTPNLVALDNEEAKIVVGQNVPFLTGSFTTGASATTNPFNTVERKDVGLVLRVKSQIGEGGAIRMTIVTENSSIAQGSQTNNPITDKTELQTTVTVDDGALLVLGGLMKDEFSDGEDGVPGLSKIPLLGYLFKSEKRERKKTNLMVFLRPTVLRSSNDALALSLDRYEQIRARQQAAQPQASPVLPDTGAAVLPAPPASSASGPQP